MPAPTQELVALYGCLCDRTRLRLLNLLREGPLCVCHLHDALREPQAKVSKHLGHLQRGGLVEAGREGRWMIYRLPPPARRSPALSANLACLQDAAGGDRTFRDDLARLRRVRATLDACCPACVREGAGSGRSDGGAGTGATSRA